MAYTLNTSHALYSNLIELIGVQSGALVSHKTARTFTVDGAASFGAGTWGEHFVANGSGYTDHGASFTPALGINTTTTTSYTVVAVLNASGTNDGGAAFGGTVSPRLYGPGLSAGKVFGRSNTGTTALGTTNHLLALCRIGETSAKLYVDNGTLEASGTGLASDYADPTASANQVGWVASGYQCHMSIVWIAVFNKELSSAEIGDLYSSLGASNAFGLVEAAGGGAPSLVVSDGAHAHAADNLALTIIGTLTIADATHSHTTDSITLTAVSNGTITVPAVRDWGTKVLKTGQTGVQVDIRNISTGALVVRLTGQTTHATTGVCVVTDAAIVAGTTYEVVTRFADGSRGMWDYTAS